MDTCYLTEKHKYEKMWKLDVYRQRSPGLLLSTFFFHHFQGRIHPGDSIIDFGCGTGAASMLFFDKELSVTLVDIANNCLDGQALERLESYPDRFSFVQAPLWDLPQDMPAADWIYCIDVLEHLPPSKVAQALQSMAGKMKKGGALQVFLEDETMGSHIGESLHLTIKPLSWWLEQISCYLVIENVQEIIPHVRYCVYVESLTERAIDTGG